MKKLITVLAGISLAFGISTTAMAHTGGSADGSHEEDVNTYDCPATEAEAAGTAAEGQCTYDDQGNLSPAGQQYSVTEWDNEVTCADNQGTKEAGLPVAINGEQQGTGGYLEVCSDGDLPVHGRIILSGGAEQGGGSITADGDATNEAIAEQLGGWARIDVSSEGVTVSCGDAEGNLDATHSTSEDTQEDCG